MNKELRPNDSEKEFLNLAYNRFYDIFEEMMDDSFFERDARLRFCRIKDGVAVYAELLNYEPIKWVIKHLETHRPPMESVIGSKLFKFVRNIIAHFPFYETWNDVYITKSLINWQREGQFIDKFLTDYQGRTEIKYRFWEPDKRQITYLSINFPLKYDDSKIYLKDMLTEKEGVKFSFVLMKQILDTQVENMTLNQNRKSEIPSTLLRFMSLNENNISRIIDTLTSSKIRCTQLWRLNDAMEGVFKISVDELNKVDKIYDEKNKYFTCSFAHPSLLEKPLLWGYYANGFKGVAIEIELDDDDKKSFHKVNYDDNFKVYKDDLPLNDEVKHEKIIEIITTKQKCWKPENEYRYIVKMDPMTSGKVFCDVKIKSLYIGYPYRNTANCDQITKNSDDLKDYRKCRKALECFCAEMLPDLHIEHRPVDPTSSL
jgi:hypothetical protein